MIRRHPLASVALLAFVAMCGQDLAGTAMVISEAHFNAFAAAGLDEAQWAMGLASAGLALNEIFKNGWSRRALVICAALSAANILGTYSGVWIGAAVTHHG